MSIPGITVAALTEGQLDALFLDGAVVFQAVDAETLQRICDHRAAAQLACPYILPGVRGAFFANPPVSAFGGICATNSSAIHRAIAAAFDPVHAQIAARFDLLRGRPNQCLHFVGPDRECYRRVGATPSEATHRDLSSDYARRGQTAKRARDSDPDLFVDGLGGWISFSGPSSFTFDRGNFELGAGRSAVGAGFHREDEDMMDETTLTLAPGDAVLFFSSLLHTVPARRVREAHWRQFIAAGFTFSREGNFHPPEVLAEHFDNLHPFPLPSGQPPRVWPRLYDVNHRSKRDALRAFFDPRLTADDALHRPVPPSPLYPAFTDAERALYRAHRTARDAGVAQ